jgi:threonine synthase
MKFKLKCISCEKIFNENEVEYTCPKCGNRMGTLEVIYDYDNIQVKKSDFYKTGNIWQFEKILPVKKDSYRTNIEVGGTPFYTFENFEGVRKLSIKNCGTNPTASFKDRASAIAVTKAVEKNFDTIYCASTGNAASSLAGISSTSPLKTIVFLPSRAPKAKMIQIVVYGALIVPVETSYDKIFDLSMEIGNQNNWYCRNSAINPYLLEGKKTAALEIIVQNNFKVPEYIFVSVGDGTVISSFYKGFYDFFQLGLINNIPKIIGIQAAKSNSVKKAFENGEPFKPFDIEAETTADSICVGTPRDVIKACKYVKKSGGFFITVEDEEIINAGFELARKTGVFAEPAGSASYAGFKKAIDEKLVEKNSHICLSITGNGLKDIKAFENDLNINTLNYSKADIMDYIKNWR